MSSGAGRSVSAAFTEVPVEPRVSALCVIDGVTVKDSTPFAQTLTPPADVVRDRQSEQLFFLLNPTDAATPHLCRELREVATQTYWATSGSVTAALRRAVSVVNVYLFEHNLNADPTQRCYAGLSCAVLRENDLFLLQAGPAWACVLEGGRLRCFPRGERLAHIGIRPVVDVRLHHALASPGDTLLLTSFVLLQKAGREGLLRVLQRVEVESVKTGLEQLGEGADFAALIVRWVPALDTRAEEARSPLEGQPREVPSSMDKVPAHASAARAPAERELESVPPYGTEQLDATDLRTGLERREPRSRQSIDVGAVLMRALRPLGRVLGYAWHGFAAVLAGVAALGRWLIGAVATTVRRTLPGPQREAYRQAHRRLPPKEHPTGMMVVAAAIPILAAAVVTVAYLTLAVESRFQAVVRQAEGQIALAELERSGSNAARAHWEQALQQIDVAATLQPEDPYVQTMREQVRDALDRLDSIERLELRQLVDLGASGVGRRLVVHGQMAFVLDSNSGWAARVPLDGAGSEPGDQEELVLAHTGLEVDGDDVGQLVDCAWVGPEGGRRMGALVVLEEDGGLLSYDPAWGSESGAPQVARTSLRSPPAGVPLAVGSYSGQFYILAVAAEDEVQIWRYKPQGDIYPNPPEPYFATPLRRRVGQIQDMAIDGYIYILFADGSVGKFLGGEPQEFEIRGVPGGLGRVPGFAVDPSGSGRVYMADPDNLRIVELEPDGQFAMQLRAGETLAALEALAVNESEGEIYVLEEGRLHLATLP
ncbi:MAG: hypothetical protein PVH41_08125 [Anaerolineae bacterium]